MNRIQLSSHWASRLEAIGIPTIDLYPGLSAAQRSAPNVLLYRQDDPHWNDRGIKLAAEIIARHLKERGLLK